VLEIRTHVRAQRLEGIKRPEILGQLVVELRHDALPDRFHRDLVADCGARELRNRVVGGIVHVESFRLSVRQADQFLIEPGRVRRRADLDGDVVVPIGMRFTWRRDAAVLRTRRRRSLEIDNDRVAHLHAAVFHRFVPRCALAKARQRFVHRSLVYLHVLLAEREPAVVARIDRRNGLEARCEFERLPLFDDHIADVRRVHRLHASRAQRLVDSAGDEAVGHVVQNLIAEALPHNFGRHLARTESRNACGAAVITRDLVDFGVDDRAGDFDDEALAGVADVYEFGFHDQGFKGSRFTGSRFTGSRFTGS
jgi:hypothetical protein